jgi:hypothetical protein
MGSGELSAQRLRGDRSAVTRRRTLALAALVAVGAHQAVLAVGNEAAHHATGLQAVSHGAGWNAGVVLMMIMVMLAAGWMAWRIPALRLQLAVIPSVQVPGGHLLIGTWAKIVLSALAIFMLQENAEHLASHGHLPLFEPLLSGQYHAALPIFAGIALLVAVTSLVIGTRLGDLRAAVPHVRFAPARPPRHAGGRRIWLGDRRRLARLAHALSARRAPPVPVLA